MFKGCSSLLTVPDIFKFQAEEIDITELFNNCFVLTSLPEIKIKCNTKFIINEYPNMLDNCLALINSFPKLIKHEKIIKLTDEEIYQRYRYNDFFPDHYTYTWYCLE